MPRIICSHIEQEGFLQELHEACVAGIASMVEKNGLCPVCMSVGFGSAIGNMIVKSTSPPEERMQLLQGVMPAVMDGYNSVAAEHELRLVQVGIDELPRTRN